MASENAITVSGNAGSSFVAELFQGRLYKPTLGRIARQLTCGAVWLVFAIAAWRWYDSNYIFSWFSYDAAGNLVHTYDATISVLRYLLPGLLLVVGLWVGYRLVNYPKFADFLIAVEAEMNKVTWPSQGELIRSSMVVILLLLSMTFLLFVFDIAWFYFFKMLGIRI
jgi:preprotein translocase subunit SecE